jgi:NADH:ubiquinone oxidoreductase subunit 4 (subunit M)
MLLPLCAIIIVMGIFPAPFLRRMEPTLSRLVHRWSPAPRRRSRRRGARGAGPVARGR